MIIRFILCLLLCNGYLYSQISKPTEYIPQSFDIINYKATIDLTDAPNFNVVGQCRIQFQWTTDSPQAKFYFHLNELDIDSAFYNNSRITPFKFVDFIDSDDYYEVDRIEDDKDTTLLVIYYSGKMKNAPNNDGWAGVLSENQILYSMGVGFVNKSVSATRYWLPCYDHPSDKANFSVRYIVPDTMTVASVGNFSSVNNENGTKTYTFTHNYPIATYLMTFAVGNFIRIENNYNDLPIEIYSLPQDSAASEYYYGKLPEMLSFFESVYGDYPFEKVGYVNTPTGSMEHQTMISLAESIVRSAIGKRDTVALTAAHELSHQWFGNSLTPYDFRDAWLNEGLATYSEALWLEHLFGNKKYLEKISIDVIQYVNYTYIDGLKSLYDFDRTVNYSNYPYTIYKKGSAVIGLLRYLMGDEHFFEAIKYYCDTYKYSNVTTEDFKQAMERISGKNLDEFFEQWVYQRGHPHLEIYFDKYLTSGVDSLNITIKQVQGDSVPIFTILPFQIEFMDADGEFHYELFEITQKEQTFTVYDLPEILTVNPHRGDKVQPPVQVRFMKYLGVEDGNQAVEIFPNPAYDHINVSIGNLHNSENIYLYDIFGKVLDIIKIYEESATHKIDITHLPSGVYIVRYGNKTEKFIKM